MTIRYLKVFRHAGAPTTVGARADLPAEQEALYVSSGLAEYLYREVDTKIPATDAGAQVSTLTRRANVLNKRWGRRPMVGGLYGAETGAQQFRQAGGKVVCYYYGEWRQHGNNYNRWPWKWFQQYSDRLPLLSAPMPSTQKWPFKHDTETWLFSNSTFVHVGAVALTADWAGYTASSASASVAGSTVTLTSTADFPLNAIYTSPSGSPLGIPCDDVSEFRMLVELTQTSATRWWKGRIYYTTADNQTFDETKTLQIPEPLQTSGRIPLIVPIPTNQSVWTGKTLRQVRFDLWGGVGVQFKVYEWQTFQGYARLTATTSDPVVRSPETLGLDAAQYKTVKVKVRKIAGTTWQGTLFWITEADQTFNAAKSVSVAEPSWDGTFKTLTFDMTGDSDWTGTIRGIRLDFGAAADWIIDVKDVEIPAVAGTQAAVNEGLTYGLDSDAQFLVDWEIRTAYAHGIDVFAHNFYWNNQPFAYTSGRGNHQKYSLDRHAASQAEPNMKFCIQWSNHDSSNPFSAASDINAMLDEMNKYFGNPRYWKIGGKPVVFLFSIGKIQTWAASLWSIAADKNAVKRFIDEANAYLIALSGTYAPTGVHWVSQDMAADPNLTGNAAGWVGTNEFAGFSAGTRYAFTSYYRTITQTGSGGTSADPYPPVTEPLMSYAQLREIYLGAARWIVKESGCRLPYWYPVHGGYDCRPWLTFQGKVLDASHNCAASSEEFAAFLRDARDFTLENLTAMRSSEGPVVTMYAWNEYGEGGFIAPSRRYEYRLCEAVLRVFGHAEG